MTTLTIEVLKARLAESEAHCADCLAELHELNHAGAALAERRGIVRTQLEATKVEHEAAHAAIVGGMADQSALDKLAPALAELVRLNGEMLRIENEMVEIQCKHEAARLDKYHAEIEAVRLMDSIDSIASLQAVRSMLLALPEGTKLEVLADELECPLERLIEIRDNASEAERLARQEQQAAERLEAERQRVQVVQAAELSVLPAFLRGVVQ